MNLNVDGEGKSGASEPSSAADRGAGVDSLAHPLTRPALLPSALSFYRSSFKTAGSTVSLTCGKV